MGNDQSEIQKSRVPDFCTSHAPDVTYIYDGFLGCSRTGRFPGLRAGVGSAHGAAQTRAPAAPRWVRRSFVLAGRSPGLRTFMGSAHEGTQTRNAPRTRPHVRPWHTLVALRRYLVSLCRQLVAPCRHVSQRCVTRAWLAPGSPGSVRHVAVSGVARAGSGWLAPPARKFPCQVRWGLVGV